MNVAASHGPLVQRLFLHLADGGLHAGSSLAAALGVSRTAIWKAVGALRALGMGIESVPRQGYRVARPYTPLDARRIEALLPARTRAALADGAVDWSAASTNSLLLALSPPRSGRFNYRIAEHQSAGRGRRGRRWLAQPGGALCLSLAWQYPALPADAGALSLAVGVGIWRVMRRFGLHAPRLKWPNDVLLGARKLCGVLLELRAETAGPALVVVGMGINCALDAAARSAVARDGTEPADLFDAGAQRVDRNEWAASLIAESVLTLQTFADSGFAGFAADWRAADALAGSPVQVRGASSTEQGIAEGIDGDGALRVRTTAGLRRFTSGDVSVRTAP